MADFISRERLIEKLGDSEIAENDRIDIGYNAALNDVKQYLTEMPTADVQPVKHGRWETWGYVFHGIEWERCSVCGKTADVSYIALLEGRIEPVTPSFCGCCGAIMDGDTE